MNRIKPVTISLLCLASAVSFAQKPMAELIEESLSLCRTQSLILARTLASEEAALPRSFADGKLITSDYGWWCSGFFPACYGSFTATARTRNCDAMQPFLRTGLNPPRN